MYTHRYGQTPIIMNQEEADGLMHAYQVFKTNESSSDVEWDILSQQNKLQYDHLPFITEESNV